MRRTDMPLCGGAAVALLAALAVMPPLAGGRVASGVASGGVSGVVSGAASGAAPAFLPRQRTAVLARVGDSAELACRVLRLADRTVSWVRSSDLQILTHAGAVFTADSRVSCAEGSPGPPEPPEPPEPPAEDPFDVSDDPPGGPRSLQGLEGPVSLHTLRIARLRLADSGRYECQVNTEPKMSLFFNLTVVESALPKVVVWAMGRGVVRGARGGAARLACGARYEPPAPLAAALPPLRITWTHAGRDIDPQSARGGVSLESERWAGGAVSRLTLGALGAADGGRYTCRAADAGASLTLHVTDEDTDYAELGDVVGEMQRDQAAASAPPGPGAPRAPRAPWPALLLALAALATS